MENKTELTGLELLQKLNSERTQGEWIVDGHSLATGINPTDETIFLADCGEDYEYPSIHERSEKEALANLQYAALAVRNFAPLVEALQAVMNDLPFQPTAETYAKIEQALKNI